MIDIIIKGLIIGLSISVPLGPIGMLCIQRTLSKGKKYGIFTGFGATTSDLVYTIITLFFLSFIIQTIEQYKFVIQLFGSLIIFVFGLYIFKSNPATQPQPDIPTKESIFGDFITSFFLTLSNPLIVFILIALFARFEFITIESTFFYSAIGILSILGGATLWWTVLTLFVSKFKNKLNMRGLKIINHITGTIIMLTGCVGFILSLLKY
ncbi:MAG: LysE family transporter [Paludibacter sp.]|nr:LysE family transporter [Paludibacter sp.]